jgi:hypothetical protein
VAALSALAAVCVFGPAARAGAAPPTSQVRFSTPTLFPKYAPGIHDYVVRCDDAPVNVNAHATGGWEAAIGSHPFRRGDFSETVPLAAGRAFSVKVRKEGQPHVYRYHVRCLPSNFPAFTFTRYGPVSPKHFSVDLDFNREDRDFGVIFDNNGVPVWWYEGPTQDTRVLANGNVQWFNRSASVYDWEVHRLDGSVARTFDPVFSPADPHDLQPLENGGYLFGAYVPEEHVDTSAYGGSSDATVINAELVQVSPANQVAWSWKSRNHIGLEETGRFWRRSVNNPTPWGYDILHWNSIELAGNSVIASFRHLDAVYKINKSTRKIVWKLGGTTTPESLEVLNDPHQYTFGAQHDARVLDDGTVTVFDNRTNLRQKRPRAVRYRIDRQRGTATLVQMIRDAEIPVSYCCGSARRLGNGDWLIGWGRNNPIGGYQSDGDRTFILASSTGGTYRAEPVPAGVISNDDLRRGMSAMASQGG